MEATEPFELGGEDGGPVSIIAQAQAPATLDDWDVARQIPTAPDRAFLVGRFIHGGNPPNRNGHIFRINEMARAQRLIPHSPLDMLHDPNRIVGTFAASTIVHPTATARQAAPTFLEAPYIKVLASVWSYHFPEATRAIAKAFDNGTAFFSHSCLPSMVECPTCHHRSPWLGYINGVANPSANEYCVHMGGTGEKEFEDPLFLGGAVIIPPIKPGWSSAHITQVERFAARNSAAAEQAYAAVNALAGNASEREIEDLAAQVMKLAYPGHPDILAEVRRLTPGFSPSVAAAERQERALAADHSGVIVAVVPPVELCEALAEVGDQTAEEIHLTLLPLGSISDGQLRLPDGSASVSIEVLATAISVWSDSEKPLMATTSGVGSFRIDEGEENHYVSVDAPGLSEMRARLVKALQAAGVEIDNSHGFTPHITVKVEGDAPAVDEVAGRSWLVESVEIWWGDTHVPLELG